MDSSYFDEEILETIETLGWRYVIKGKAYPTLMAQAIDPNLIFGADKKTRKRQNLLPPWTHGRKIEGL
jgi:hypothetical protein